MPWRRKQQPTPVFLPGKSHGQRSLMGYSSGGHKTVRHNLATKQQQLVTLVNWTSEVISSADWVSASLQSPNCSQVLGSAVGSSHFLCGLSSLLVLEFLLRGRGPILRAKPRGWILPPTCLPSDPVILLQQLPWAEHPCYHVSGDPPLLPLPRQTTSKHHRAHQTKPLLQVNLLHQPSRMYGDLLAAGPTLQVCQVPRNLPGWQRCKLECEVILLEPTSWIWLVKGNVLYKQTVTNIYFYGV